MSAPTELEKALAWLIDNSEGVVGLRLDGEVMPWSDVLGRYLPWWSGDFVDREMERETGIAGLTYDLDDESDGGAAS